MRRMIWGLLIVSICYDCKVVGRESGMRGIFLDILYVWYFEDNVKKLVMIWRVYFF